MDTLITYLTSPTFGFFLKLLVGLATAGFGILGIGSKTRDDDGHLTRGGRIALIGIIVAAALGIGSLLYEFASGQEKARTDRRRSERLMLSVQRGVYPMRGVTVSFQMDLDGDVLGAYKTSLRDEISKDRQCKTAGLRFECYGRGENGAYLYRIYSSSPLFPKSHSSELRVLEKLKAHVSFYQRMPNIEGTTKDAARVKYLGRFFVDWDSLPNRAWLTYDYDRNALAFNAEDYRLKDEEIATAGIYSLVDFIPGLVAVRPQVNGDSLCERLQLTGKACVELIEPLEKGLSLREIQLGFPYPKTLRLADGLATRCASRQGEYLLLQLPDDIEAIDGLGNIESLGEAGVSEEICSVVEASREQ